MAAEIVNLRRARKAKARAVREQEAAENRAKFGRTKQARKADDAATQLAERQHDGHRRDTPSDDGPAES